MGFIDRIETQDGTRLIQYKIKNVYGVDRLYITDEFIAKAFEKLTGRKTLLNSDIESLEMLGFKVEEVWK